ncbi:MAG: DinB family protein [Candidatus Delongbacteria bacterium]
MEPAPRPGALGALIDELQRALAEVEALLLPLDAAALDRPRAEAGEFRTVREVVEHVLYSAHVYHNLQRQAFGLPEVDWSPPGPDAAELVARLRALPAEAWDLLADKTDWTDEQVEALRIHAGWGTVYDLEQLLEHALVHVLRHRRQLEHWLDG